MLKYAGLALCGAIASLNVPGASEADFFLA
jgi:hypothetical protein